MTNIIDKYYNKVQDILLKGNSSDFDNDEYSHIVIILKSDIITILWERKSLQSQKKRSKTLYGDFSRSTKGFMAKCLILLIETQKVNWP